MCSVRFVWRFLTCNTNSGTTIEAMTARNTSHELPRDALPLIRTLTVGPGIPPARPVMRHPDGWASRFADFYRRFRLTLTPERVALLITAYACSYSVWVSDFQESSKKWTNGEVAPRGHKRVRRWHLPRRMRDPRQRPRCGRARPGRQAIRACAPRWVRNSP